MLAVYSILWSTLLNLPSIRICTPRPLSSSSGNAFSSGARCFAPNVFWNFLDMVSSCWQQCVLLSYWQTKKKKKLEKFQACFMFVFQFTVYNSMHIQALPPNHKEWAFPEGWANPMIPVIVGHAYQSQMNAENLKFEPIFLLSCFPATHCRMGFSSPEC